MDSCCEICGDSFTSHKRKRIECVFCNKGACSVCTQNYLLSNSNDPQCMFCRAAWNREFLDMNFTAAFRTGPFRLHRQRVLLERERSLFPETMPAVERVVLNRKRKRELEDLDERIRALAKAQSYLYEQRRRLRETPVEGEVADTLKRSRRAVLCHCPADRCRGFVRTSDGKCIVCDKGVCKACLEPLKEGDAHECDPNAVATASALQKETKPCPSCQVPIYRTEGCSQMWCTHCNTAFDWNTLAVSKGNIHNPHYFEFVRRGGGIVRAPEDVVCGGLPRPEDIRSKVRGCGAPLQKTVFNALQCLTHIQDVDLHDIRVRAMARPANTEDVRIRYLLNGITEGELAQELWRTEKRIDRERAQLDLLEMLCTVGVEVFQRLMAGPDTPPGGSQNVEEVVQSLEALRVYFNEMSQRLSKRFQLSQYKAIAQDYDRVAQRTLNL